MTEIWRTNLEGADEKYADLFDFTGLKSFAPAGLRVLESRDYFHAVRETAKGTTHFFIVKRGGKFKLYSVSSATTHTIGIELAVEQNLILERDQIGPVLKLLGYNT